MTTLSINWSHRGEMECLVCVYIGLELVALELWPILLHVLLSSAVLLRQVSGD